LIPAQLREFLCIGDIMVDKLQVGNLLEHIFIATNATKTGAIDNGYFAIIGTFIGGASSFLGGK
jgi:hypothetical protein